MEMKKKIMRILLMLGLMLFMSVPALAAPGDFGTTTNKVINQVTNQITNQVTNQITNKIESNKGNGSNGMIGADEIKTGEKIDIGEVGNTNTTQDIVQLIKNDKKTGLMDILQKVGYLLLVLSIGQMVLAFKDDNADAKSRASMTIIAAVFLIALPMVMNGLFGNQVTWMPEI